MRIVHAVSELFPYVKTGGLADAVGALSRTLAGLGHDVAIFLPGYREAIEHPELSGASHVLTLGVEMGDVFLRGDVLERKIQNGLTIYLICRDEYFDRKQLYGNKSGDYDDNAERFLFFSKAIVATIEHLRLKPDVMHCHDWQTALVPILLRHKEHQRIYPIAGKTILTIHNIAFQGIFPQRVFPLTNLPGYLMGIDGLEYYGKINYLKGGILFSDRVGTVSRNYCREILTPEFGYGLEGVLSTRRKDLFCHTNGIDVDLWDPSLDSYLPANYSVDDLSNKAVCQRHLLEEMRLRPKDKESGPVFGMICRLTTQKGIELLRGNISFFLEHDVRLVILGNGNGEYEKWLNDIAQSERGRGKISLCVTFDEGLSHLIEAGADFFLMPSIFEPCGLNQMYSMRYGTVPVVSRVGGLVDTVTDIEDDPENGTGIVVSPTADGLQAGLKRALDLYNDRKRMRQVMISGMKRDFSWKSAALGYQSVYEEML